MAKLNGVKTVDMVNGEITKVSYEGAEYAKTNEPVKDGDLFQLRKGHYVMGGEVGAFYTTYTYRDGSIAIPTEYDGNATYTQLKGWGVAFRKISANKPTLEQVAKRVETLEGDVAALKGDKVAEETIEFEGATYRKVEREAREGDVVIFTDGISKTSWITIGKPYKVFKLNECPKTYGDDGDRINIYRNDDYKRTRETVDVYEPIEQAKYVPQEGDIVVITAEGTHAYKVGELVRITSEFVRKGGQCNSETINGEEVFCSWLFAEEVRKATLAEVEKYEQAVKDASKPKLKAGDFVKFANGTPSIKKGKMYEVFDNHHGLYFVDEDGDKRWSHFNREHEIIDAETAKWAKINRKPNEFKKGDVVRVVCKESSRFTVGTLGVVMKDEIDSCCRPTTEAITTEGDLASYHPRVELVAPVESLFN